MSNFSLSVDVSPNTSGVYNYGIWFNIDDANVNGYYFHIQTGSQSYSLSYLKNNSWQDPLIDWTYSPLINETSKNQLAVKVSGLTVSLYVNGYLLQEKQLPSVTISNIQFALGTYTSEVASVTVAFDNLIIAVPSSQSANPTSSLQRGRVTSWDGVNVRSKPNAGSTRIGILRNGAEITILSSTDNGGWYSINYRGQRGWVSSDLIEIIISSNQVR